MPGIFLGCSVLFIVLMASPITDAEPGSEDVGPKIVSVIHKCTGKQYRVTCRVKTQRDDDETIVYWLINNDFAESVYPDDSTQRVRTKTKSADHEHLATLMFKKVLPEDYSANLTCVALSPVGFDQSTTTLKKCDPKMMLKKRRECKMAE
ncbi:hypothetical protein NFI96_018905 [Prochilodus magdalenae]|nr:hypothetical protein NFI96_018905 [Prochilodus magdalenae]